MGDNSGVLLVGLLFLFFALHPFVTYPISLIFLSYIKKDEVRSVISSSIVDQTYAVCFCAYNEENDLKRRLENLLSINNQERLKVYVFFDGCTDSSVEIATGYSDKITMVVSDENVGKSTGLNMLLSKVQEDIVIFTDANVVFDKGVISEFDRTFERKDIGCVIGRLEYINTDHGATAEIGGLYWKFEEWLKGVESDIGNSMGADGSIFAIRKELFKNIPNDMIPDLFSSFEVLYRGYFIKQNKRILAYERHSTEVLDEFKRKVRITCRAFNYTKKNARKIYSLSLIDLYMFVSHKILRWLCFMSIVLSGLLLALYFGYAFWFIFLSVCSFPLVRYASRKNDGIVGKLSNIVLSLAAASLGVLQSVSGKKYVTWKPAKSIRV